MIKKQSKILNIKLSKFLVGIGLLISINGIDAAEGGPCKDYGECDDCLLYTSPSPRDRG